MTEQLNLLSWTPPEPYSAKGATFDSARDGKRLGEQAARVHKLMSDGMWHTLSEISSATGDPEASVSARLRDLRRFGFVVERAYIANGLHKYRMVLK